MSKLPAFQFYPGDWLRDVGVQSASFETRGFWVELLIRMWDAPKRGKLEIRRGDLRRLLNCNADVEKRCLAEIKRLGIADVTHSNGKVTIVNRRMFKDQIEREKTRERVRHHREKEA